MNYFMALHYLDIHMNSLMIAVWIALEHVQWRSIVAFQQLGVLCIQSNTERRLVLFNLYACVYEFIYSIDAMFRFFFYFSLK